MAKSHILDPLFPSVLVLSVFWCINQRPWSPSPWISLETLPIPYVYSSIKAGASLDRPARDTEGLPHLAQLSPASSPVQEWLMGDWWVGVSHEGQFHGTKGKISSRFLYLKRGMGQGQGCLSENSWDQPCRKKELIPPIFWQPLFLLHTPS